MGDLGTQLDKQTAITYIHGDMFEVSCEFLGWESDWVVDVFYAVDDLPDAAKHQIARECAMMLSAIPFKGLQ